MTTLSIRLPDEMADRLKNIAQSRNMSLDSLMLEFSSRVVAEEDARQQFLAAQLRGKRERGLQTLAELDALDS